jgi:hypothetical protein
MPVHIWFIGSDTNKSNFKLGKQSKIKSKQLRIDAINILP